MRKLLRLFLSPSIFFNQLQWSRSHWLILFALGVFCLTETHTSQGSSLYPMLTDYFQSSLGLGFTASIWLLSALKLSVIYAGVYLMTQLIWVVGNTIGEKGSKRVLLRRLAVVFTVFLAGASIQNLSDANAWLILVSAALYIWGTILGFYAVKEQFELNSLETAIVTTLSALVISATLHVTDHAKQYVAEADHNDNSAISNRLEESENPFQLDQ